MAASDDTGESKQLEDGPSGISQSSSQSEAQEKKK